MSKLIHGLDVCPASTADRPAYLCYTPDYAEYCGGKEFWFEGSHVGAIVHDEEAEAWYPCDTDWWPLDQHFEPINTTFGRPDENRARMQFFPDRAGAVRFLATWWNLQNPSAAVRIEPQGVAA